MVKAKIEIQAESKLPMPPSKSDDLGYDLVCAVLATRVLVSPAKHYQVGTMWSDLPWVLLTERRISRKNR